MTLPSSGALSMSQINSELGLFVVPGRAATDTVTFDETEVRWLASKIVANSPVVLPDDFWGKGFYELTADVDPIDEPTPATTTPAPTTTTTTTTPAPTTTTTTTTPAPTTTTTTTTLPPAIIPSVIVSGPACVDTTQPSVQILVDFSSPVTGFLASELQTVGLTPTGVTTADNMRYTVFCNLTGIPYGISNRRTANLKGSSGLTLLLATVAGNVPQNIYPTVSNSYGARDESIIPTTLPFNVAFPTSPTTSITGNTFWITSNSIIYLSGPTQDRGTGYPLSLSAPPVPAIVIGSTDGGVFNIYGGSDDGGATYRIRWEGVAVYNSATIDKVWEITFYASDPTKYSIDISSAWVSGGTSYIKNNTTQLYDLTSEVAANKGFDVSFAYQAQVLAGVAQSSTGNGNTISNLLRILPC